jgi:thiamine biosynthesis lipoprotein
MGTTYNVTLVFSEPKSSTYISLVHQNISSSLSKIDRLMSTYKPDSEVSRFNSLAVKQQIDISPDTVRVLNLAANINQLSSGSFDITIGPLVDLWGFGSKSTKGPILPIRSQIVQARDLLGFDKFALVDSSLRKLAPVQIDLSAIAKGYAVDVVASALAEHDVKDFLVEVGGEVAAKGVNQKGLTWLVGIERPDVAQRSLYSAVSLKDVSMATSGDYRNYFEHDSRQYSHTIDPRTGSPVTHQLASVSVIAESCAEADALATALMVMGEIAGYEFAQKNHVSAYFIFRDGDGFLSISSHLFDQYVKLR